MSQIVPLHVHTHFSSLGGPGSPREWCARAAALGYEALGVADRGPLVAHLELAAAAREAGIKPLFGMEVDLLLALPPADEPKGKKKSEGGSQKSEVVQPILLFARDGEGLDNLAALASVAYKGWPRREQAITWEAVASRAGGLLAVLLAADQAGRAPLGSVQPKRLSELGAELHEAFGGMAFMGLPAPLPGDDSLTRQAQATANYLGLAPIALPTARYLERGDAQAYQALQAARRRAGWQYPDQGPGTRDQKGLEYLLPPDEAEALFSAWPEAVELGASIAEMCGSAEYGARSGEPARESIDREALRARAERGLRERLGSEGLPDEAVERLEREMAAVGPGVERAWLALVVVGKAARKERIPLGAPLGGAADTLLAYALGLSDYDPTAGEPPAWLQEGPAPAPGIEVPGSCRIALLSAVAKELGADGFAHAACLTEMTPLHALRAAADVREVLDEALAATAISVLEQGWEALDGEERGEAAPVCMLARALKDAPIDLKPDPDTLLFAIGGETTELPVLGDESRWVPCIERDAQGRGFAALNLCPTRPLEVLDGALRMARRHAVPGLRAEVADLTRLPTVDEGVVKVLKGGKLIGLPYLTSESANGLVGSLASEDDGEGEPAAIVDAMEKSVGVAARSNLHAWARVALWSAVLKSAHPAALLASAIEVARYAGGRDTPSTIVSEARGLGVTVLPPDASLSAPRLALEPNARKAEGRRQEAGDGRRESEEGGDAGEETGHSPWAILWGLAYLPGWGLEIAEKFVAERPREGIGSLGELADVAVRAGLSDLQVEMLVRAGACDRLGGKEQEREEMAERVPDLMAWARREGATQGERDLFSVAAQSKPPDEEGTEAAGATYERTPLSPRERYLRREWEKRNLGVGFTDAPEMDAFHEALDRSGGVRERLLTTAQVGDEGAGKSVLLVGLLCGIRLLAAPDGSQGSAPLATAQLEDGAGSIELVAFPPNYARHRALWTEGNAVIVTARVSAHDDGEPYLLCEHIAPLSAGEEEEEIKIRVKPSRGMKSAKGAIEEMVEIAAPKEGAARNGAHPAPVQTNPTIATTARSNSYQQPASSWASPDSGSPGSEGKLAATNGNGNGNARYRVVITLPNVDDDHEAIDAMIALNSTLGEHPGEDIVTVRIPYLAGSQRMATVQLPRGVSFTHDLRDRLERSFSPQAVAVIELG